MRRLGNLLIFLLSSIFVIAGETVTDICGNTYNVVHIGHQTWMAENFKCDKYDTNSRLAGQTISRVADNLNPYCTDSKELINGQPHFSDMSEVQINSLGTYYTWDAAVGAIPIDGVLFPTKENPREINYYSERERFEGTQGICPNGWHVPSEREFEELIATCGGLFSACIKLLSKKGWLAEGEKHTPTTDEFGFNLLPNIPDFSGADYGVQQRLITYVGQWK